MEGVNSMINGLLLTGVIVVTGCIASYVVFRRSVWRDKRCLELMTQYKALGIPCVQDERGKIHLYRPIRAEGTVCSAKAKGKDGGLAFFFAKYEGMYFCHQCLRTYDPLDTIPSDMVRRN